MTFEPAGMEADLNTESAPSPRCSFNIAYVVKRAHAHHGLRHDDYNRYRLYCSRRIHRLRKVLNLTHGKKKFSKRDITDTDLTSGQGRENVLQIPLYEAERCWAYAMELKADQKLGLKDQGTRSLHHVRNKLKVAAKHAAHLDDLCSLSGFCDERTGLEAKAYSSWMSGILAFELQQWAEAVRLLDLAKKIWKQFADTCRSEDLKAMYVQRIEALEPSIRYCAYSLGDNTVLEDLLSMKNVDQSVLAKMENIITDTSEETFKITWRDREIQIPNDKLRMCIMRINEKVKGLKQAQQKKGMATRDVLKLYDGVFMSIQDALQAYRSEKMKESTAPKTDGSTVLVGGGGEDANEIPKVVELYLNCQRYLLQNERNQLMVDAPRSSGKEKPAKDKAGGSSMFCTTNKPEENVRLYDSILQNLTGIINLVRDTDPLYVTELEIWAETYQAFRVYCIANAYAHVGKFAEADKVYDLLTNMIATINMALASSSEMAERSKQEMSEKILKLVSNIRERKCMLKAAMLLASDASSKEETGVAKIPAWDRLDTYDDTPVSVRIASVPPSLQYVACKPLFFDVASANLPLPDIQTKIEEPTQGISGLVSSMFGGWGGKK